MALGTFIAGRYSSTWNAVGLGITRDGYRVEFQAKAEMLNRTDAYGDTTIDGVYRGGDYFCEFVSKEYTTGTIAAAWPYGATVATIYTTAAPIGRLLTAIWKALVLTSTPNTPAAAAPATLTASQAGLAPDFNVQLLFDSRLREVPVRMQFLPSETTGTGTAFTLT